MNIGVTGITTPRPRAPPSRWSITTGIHRRLLRRRARPPAAVVANVSWLPSRTSL
jgi:hypothetical protein